MLYCLTHANVLSQSGVPDHLDRKRIGHYSTLPKALAARERAARLKRWRPAKSSSMWMAGRRALPPVYIHDHEFAALSP